MGKGAWKGTACGNGAGNGAGLYNIPFDSTSTINFRLGAGDINDDPANTINTYIYFHVFFQTNLSL